MTSGVTERDRAKADRQAAILHEAARLFAERGFSGVSLEELGAAVGVSGPAVYRHFANKQALLGAILVRVSERLLHGGQQVDRRERLPRRPSCKALIAFHVDFALTDADVIRVQDRDLASLSDDDRHRCAGSSASTSNCGSASSPSSTRRAPRPNSACERTRASVSSTRRPTASRRVRRRPADSTVRGILESMAFAALTA